LRVKSKIKLAESPFKLALKIPGSLMTAILFSFSLDDIAKKALPKINSSITMGNKKVDNKNVLLRTLVKYSLFIISHILFIHVDVKC
jgi:hypothetical protein